MSHVYLNLSGHGFLKLKDDGETLEVAADKAQASTFPEDVADQVIEALQQAGITQEVVKEAAEG